MLNVSTESWRGTRHPDTEGTELGSTDCGAAAGADRDGLADFEGFGAAGLGSGSDGAVAWGRDSSVGSSQLGMSAS
jgi:hypothetical protein